MIRHDWTLSDLRGTVRSLPLMWELALDGIDAALVEDGDPSPAMLRARADAALADAGDDPGALQGAVEMALAALSAVGRRVAASGHGAAPGAGRVAGVFASGGGVPKLPIDAAQVGPRGVIGDVQASRQHHGRPWQALCLWSADVVARLAAEGHPIAPGNAGENVSVAGVDWGRVRPGTRLRLGTVVAEVTAPALPCAKNRGWFLGGDFDRMGHEREAGVTRWYASVLEPGTVSAGDEVVVEPDLFVAAGRTPAG